MTNHLIYSSLENISSAIFFGCCSNSTHIVHSCSKEVLCGCYVWDNECFDYCGNGVGFGVGNSWGEGNGIGDSGDEPIDIYRTYGDGIMSGFPVSGNFNFVNLEVEEQELFFIERSYDD